MRWRYDHDAANQGRGVYVDRVRVDGKRIPDYLYAADGWTRSPNEVVIARQYDFDR